MLQKIKVNNIDISCTISGHKSDSCLLFMHGLQSRKEIFSSLQACLAQNLSLQQLACDFVGFGRSEKPADFSYALEDQAQIILDILAQLKIAKAYVIGHSFGGMIGTYLLKQAPGLIQALANLEGNLCLDDCGESRNATHIPFDDFCNSFYPSLKNRLAKCAEPSASLRYQSLSMLPDYAFYKISKTIVEWSEKGELLDIFASSQKPKLLLYSANGSYRSRINNTTTSSIEIPNSGHFMPIDNPAATEKAVLNFLKKVCPNGSNPFH